MDTERYEVRNFRDRPGPQVGETDDINEVRRLLDWAREQGGTGVYCYDRSARAYSLDGTTWRHGNGELT